MFEPKSNMIHLKKRFPQMSQNERTITADKDSKDAPIRAFRASHYRPVALLLEIPLDVPNFAELAPLELLFASLGHVCMLHYVQIS